MGVKKTDPRPPYVQVTEDLRNAIESGQYQPGERLPSGRDMAKQYGVALMTLQRALNTLATEGLVVSYQGRGVWVQSAELTAVGQTPDVATLTQRLEDLEKRVRKLERRRGGKDIPTAP